MSLVNRLSKKWSVRTRMSPPATGAEGAAARARSALAAAVKPCVEQLELRRLMTVTAGVEDGTLKITSDAGHDHINLRLSGSNLLVSGATSASFDRGTFDKIVFSGNAGQDGISVDELNGPIFTDTEALSIDGGTEQSGGSGWDWLYVYRNADITLDNSLLQVGTAAISAAGFENAYLHGGADHNTLDASAFSGQVTLYGSGGNDALKAGRGGSWMSGDAGVDSYAGGTGSDRMYEVNLPGVVLTNSTFVVGVDVSTISSIESAYLHGDSNANTLDASDFNGNVELYGNGGNDALTAGKGGSYMDGSLGDDSYRGGAGNDEINDYAYAAQTTLTDGSLSIGSVQTAIGSIERARLHGDNNANAIDASGFSGYVALYGNGGNDSLIAGKGGSRLDGGAGSDTFRGGAGQDAVYESGLSGDVVLTNATLTVNGAVQDLGSIEQAYLHGDEGANTLDASGFNGYVQLIGNGGNDVLKASRTGGGYLHGGVGDDLLDGTASTSYLDLYGEAGQDTLKAGGGGSWLDGGAGTDSYQGGAGNDRLAESSLAGEVVLTNGFLTVNGAAQSLASIEQAYLYGDDGANTLDASGFNGYAQLIGNGGNDTLKASRTGGGYLDGGSGSNAAFFYGTAQNDIIEVHANSAVLINGTWTSVNFSSFTTITIDAGDGIDRATVSGTPTAQVTFLNLEPHVSIGGDTTLAEGSTLNRVGSFVDPSSTSGWTATVDYGDGSGAEPLALNADKTFSLSHRYADNGSYSVTVSISNGSGTGTSKFKVTANNVAPQLAVSGEERVDEGSTYTLLLGALTDPGADTVTKYTVRWGDGTTDAFDAADRPADGKLSHVYADGTVRRTITITLTDEDGDHGAATKTITVANVAPALTLTGPSRVEEGQPYTLTLGAVTDPGQDTVSRYVIHWGDGASQSIKAADLPESRQVTHTYADNGAPRVISVDLVDEDSTAVGSNLILDPSFGNGGIVKNNFRYPGWENGLAVATTQAADGKVIVLADTQTGRSFVRYNSDGSLDTSFGTGGRVAFTAPGNFGHNVNLMIDAAGRMLVAGYVYSGSTSGYDFAVARYAANGSVDTSFGTSGRVVVDVGGSDDVAQAATLDPDGRLLLTGYTYNSANGSYDLAVVRLLADGSRDTTFGTNGVTKTHFSGGWENGRGVAVAPDGKVMVLADTNIGLSFVRYNADGTLDTTFGTGGRAAFTYPANFGFYNALNLTIDATGRMLVAGVDWSGAGGDMALARYGADGALDAAFGSGGKLAVDLGAQDVANGLSIDAQGRLVLTGFTNSNGNGDLAVVRLLGDYTPDASFGTNGVVETNFDYDGYESGRAIASARTADGKIVALADTSTGLSFVRYNADGTLDVTFGTGGRAAFTSPSGFGFYNDINLTLDEAGRILVAGVDWNWSDNAGYNAAVVRYAADGSLDTSFGSGGKAVVDFGWTEDYANGIAVDSDGRLVLTGFTYNSSNGTYDVVVARLLADGSRDTNFGNNGVRKSDFGGGWEYGRGVAVAPDGKVVVLAETNIGWSFVRYNSDGSLDTSFGTGGRTALTFPANFGLGSLNLAIDAEGRLMVAGVDYSNGSNVALVRYDQNGTLDTAFGSNGKAVFDLGSTNESASNLAVDVDGRVLLTGYTYNATTQSYDITVLRLIPESTGSKYERVVQLELAVDNVAPTAMPDTASTAEDAPVAIAPADLLANDSDAAGAADPLTVIDVTQPTHGVAVLNEDGTVTYTPVADFHGPDSFTYIVSDGDGGTGEGIVSVAVASVNDAPAGAGRTVTTPEDVAYAFATADFGFADAKDGNAFAAIKVSSLPTAGSLRLAGGAVAEGQLVSVADIADGKLAFIPAANAHGAAHATFRFQVRDDGGTDGGGVDLDTSPDTITIDVTAVNDTPTVTDDEWATAEDVPLAFAASELLTNDRDADGDELVITEVGTAAQGAVTLVGGQITYTPSAHYNGADSFEYVVSDGVGGTATGTVNITVSPVNDLPVAVDGAASGDENAAAITGQVSGTDEENSPLTYAVHGDTPSGLTFRSDGSFSYAPARGFSGEVTFQYVANDGSSDSAPATVTITVNAVNEAPVADGDDYEVDEDGTLAIGAAAGVLTGDSDTDADGLTAVLVAGPQHGNLTLNADGSFEYKPGPDFNGADSFSYTANDGELTSEPATVTITVNAVADTPSVKANPAAGAEGAEIPLGIAAALTDTDSSESLAITIDGVPSSATLSAGQKQADGTWLLTPADLPELTLRAGDNVSLTLTVTAVATEGSNGDSASAADTLVVTVNNVGPTVTLTGDATGVRGQLRSLSGSFDDAGVVDTHTATVDFGDGTGLKQLTLNPDKTFGASHVYAVAGAYTVTVTVTDDDGGTRSETRQIDIKPFEMQGDALVVGGTSGADGILFTKTTSGIAVSLNGASLGVFNPAARVIAYGQDGNDVIQASSTLAHLVEFHGDGGNDVLTGGAKTSLLLGGAGADKLTAGVGRLVAIGGDGADALAGGSADDILIGSWTDFDGSDAQLRTIAADWSSSALFADRVAAIRTSLNDHSVWDDGDVDTLTGNKGSDWFFYSGNDTRKDVAETLTLITL